MPRGKSLRAVSDESTFCLQCRRSQWIRVSQN
jgi:hypothetical protein